MSLREGMWSKREESDKAPAGPLLSLCGQEVAAWAIKEFPEGQERTQEREAALNFRLAPPWASVPGTKRERGGEAS